ncbi:MAG: 1-acyl-sn-glycerol-3-phosphate acyltransferase, partial [Pseudomonadota bacterium]
MQYLGSLIFFLYFGLSTLVWSLVVALTPFVSYETRFELVRKWARTVMGCLRWTCRLDYEVEGADNFGDEAVVILQKHSSAWETV